MSKGAVSGDEARQRSSDRTGLVWAEGASTVRRINLSTAEIPAGAYTLRVTGDTG